MARFRTGVRGGTTRVKILVLAYRAFRSVSRVKSSWDEGQALAGLGRTALAAGRTAEAPDRLRRAQEAFRGADAAAEEAQIAAELDALDDPAAQR